MAQTQIQGNNSRFQFVFNTAKEPPQKFSSLFNQKETQKIPTLKNEFLQKAMADLFAVGKYGFVLGDGQAHANAFVSQAYIQEGNQMPLVYVGSVKDYQQYLLDVATFCVGRRVSSEKDFLALPKEKQALVNKRLENVSVVNVEGAITNQALEKILKNSALSKTGGHFICKVTADDLAKGFDAGILKETFGNKISGTFVCDQPWVVHRGPRDRKTSPTNLFNVLQTAVLCPSDRENTKRFLISNVDKIICLRAGRVQRRTGLGYCFELAKKAKKKQQAFVVEFFDNKTLLCANKVTEKKMFCWYFHTKARFSETKPEGQTFLPALWAGIA